MIQRLVGTFICVALSLAVGLSAGLSAGLVFRVPAAQASVHVYHERPGQTTLRSQQSLRDRSDRSWQAILFKRYRPDGLEGLYLRLVGFPGVVEVAPQQPLTIDTGTSLRWQAPPKLDPPTPALPGNTNQYDVSEVMADLQKAIPLTLLVPLQGNATSQLIVPPYAVQEWQELAAQTEELE